jgi:SPP1 gp7 family putative phage head morphogenesis protein
VKEFDEDAKVYLDQDDKLWLDMSEDLSEDENAELDKEWDSVGEEKSLFSIGEKAVVNDLEKELKKDLGEIEKKILVLLRGDSGLKAFGNDLVKNIVSVFNLDLVKYGVVVQGTIRKNYEIGLEKAEKVTEMNFVPNMDAVEFLESYTFDNIKDMTDDMKGKLRGELERGIMAGEGSPVLSKRVKDILDVSKTRAEVISRTESMRAVNMGQLQGWKDSGFDVEKKWDAHLDGKTSEVCKSLNGQWIDVNSTFSWKGEEFQSPPAHPNCRSSLDYRLKEKPKT